MHGIFLDIETNGLNAEVHRPLDIACKIVDFSTGLIKGEYQCVVKQTAEVWAASDLASIKMNGYSWDIISVGKLPEIVGQEIISFFTELEIQRGAAVFICQNPSFDRAFFNQLIDVYTQERLNWPYHWLDFASMYWAKVVQSALDEGKVLPEKVSVSKNDIANSYHLAPEASPHKAMQGVNHLILCYQAIFGITFKE
ncbi:MAG: 3'-5' exonuclease [Parachlamydiaceae bacterium]|nr:3'-5' exonuclease [Parachlamydiaceae bacterium]